MKPKKLAHIGIAIDDLESVLKLFEDKLGLKCSSRKVVPEYGVEIAIIPLGETALEFLKPSDINSSIKKFIDKRFKNLFSKTKMR